MTGLIEALKQYQANTVVMSSTAHGFHWNVEGPLFTEFHEFFDEIYTDVDGSLDTISEWLRKLGAYAPYTLPDFLTYQNFPVSTSESTSPLAMTRVLMEMNEKLIEDIKNMFDIATQEREQGLANFLADRHNMHKKWSWFMKTITKSTIN